MAGLEAFFLMLYLQMMCLVAVQCMEWKDRSIFLVWNTESDYISLNSCELLQTPKGEGNANHTVSVLSVFSMREKVKKSRLKNYGRR